MLGGKIRKNGHDFEDVIKAYEVWINLTKNVPQLVGEIEALTTVKYSSRWYDVLAKNRRQDFYVDSCTLMSKKGKKTRRRCIRRLIRVLKSFIQRGRIQDSKENFQFKTQDTLACIETCSFLKGKRSGNTGIKTEGKTSCHHISRCLTIH